MVKKAVNYKVRFIGEESFSFIPQKIYDCVREWYDDGRLFSLSVVDESNEDYCYPPSNFEKVESAASA